MKILIILLFPMLLWSYEDVYKVFDSRSDVIGGVRVSGGKNYSKLYMYLWHIYTSGNEELIRCLESTKSISEASMKYGKSITYGECVDGVIFISDMAFDDKVYKNVIIHELLHAGGDLDEDSVRKRTLYYIDLVK